MSKSYREQRKNRDQDSIEKTSKNKNLSKVNHRKEKFIHNALRSNNLSELIKYSEED